MNRIEITDLTLLLDRGIALDLVLLAGGEIEPAMGWAAAANHQPSHATHRVCVSSIVPTDVGRRVRVTR